jgi:hypothetical protein
MKVGSQFEHEGNLWVVVSMSMIAGSMTLELRSKEHIEEVIASLETFKNSPHFPREL